ncbi:MAG: dihydrodipicolinate synthase family protein [Chloroflexi bacterium]|nr:dihydrodipicolinate synthase family protein [Chloroflexota bacterium]
MPAKEMRGVYPILITPFDEQSRIDVESLQSLVDFLIDNGVHGIGVALGSEVFKFTDEERLLVTRTVVNQAAGRVPVVINTGGNSTMQAIFYSRMAQENGADALMVMPPSFIPVGGTETKEYFKAISDAVNIPIFIQDTTSPHVPADLAIQIARESEHVRYIKVESLPTPVMVYETAQKASGILTVFGGAGGNYFVEEMRRGSVGTMPFCSQPEAFVEVWNRYWAGDERGALDVFYRRILPVNRLGSAGRAGCYYHVHKEILRRRGVIRTAIVRGPIAPLDDILQRELQALIDELYPA